MVVVELWILPNYSRIITLFYIKFYYLILFSLLNYLIPFPFYELHCKENEIVIIVFNNSVSLHSFSFFMFRLCISNSMLIFKMERDHPALLRCAKISFLSSFFLFSFLIASLILVQFFFSDGAFTESFKRKLFASRRESWNGSCHTTTGWVKLSFLE